MTKLKLDKRSGVWYAGGKTQITKVKIKRHSTGFKDWKKAEAYRLKLEEVTQWPMPLPKPEPVKERLTIEAALEKRLLLLPEHSSSRDTNRRNVMNGTIKPLAQLKPPVVMLDEVTSNQLEDIQNSWRRKGRTLGCMRTYRSQSNAVFRWAENHRIIEHNPWRSAARLPSDSPTQDQKMMGIAKNEGRRTLPLDVDGDGNWIKVQSLLADFIARRKRCEAKPNPLLTVPGVFLALLQVMYETGLRRSDAFIFQPDWIVDAPDGDGGSYTCVQQKTGTEVTCYVPQYLVNALRGLPRLHWRGAPSRYEMLSGNSWSRTNELYPFYDGSCVGHQCYLESYLNTPLREFGIELGFDDGSTRTYDRTKPLSQSLRPHRFRDSFAVNCLKEGTSLSDLKIMLGHKSIVTTERYYAHFVKNISDAIQLRRGALRRMKYAGAQSVSQSHARVILGETQSLMIQ